MMVLLGSGSSGLFIGAVLMATLLIGGIPFREALIGGIAAIGLLLGGIAINKASDGKVLGMFERFSTMESRVGAEYNTKRLSTLKPLSKEFYEEKDRIQQPYGAKIAIHEGGIA